MSRLQQFIEALTIFAKYDPDPDLDTEHDEFYVSGREVSEQFVSEEDQKRLNELGFEWDDEVDGWRRFT